MAILKGTTMLSQEHAAALDAMLDQDLIATRRLAFEGVCDRQIKNSAAIVTAREAVERAAADRTALLAKAAAGDTVTPQQSQAAELAVRAAEGRLAFLEDTALPLAAEWARMHDAVNTSHHVAAAPIAAHGAVQYIAAAERLDAAKVEMAQAEAAIEAATATLHHAQARGYRLRAQVGPWMRDRGWENSYVRVFPDAARAREQVAEAGIAIPVPGVAR